MNETLTLLADIGGLLFFALVAGVLGLVLFCCALGYIGVRYVRDVDAARGYYRREK